VQSILLVKTNYKKLPAEDGVPADLLSVDKLSHGLLTQGIYRGFLKDLSEEMVCLRPERGPLDVIVLGADIRHSELSKVKMGFPDVTKSYWLGNFSNTELHAARKLLPQLVKWEDVEL